MNNIFKIDSYAEEFEYSCGIDLFKTAFIRKLPNGEYAILSHKGKRLGKYKTKEEAKKRLKQIEFFKNKKASKDVSYSSVMRELNKNSDEDTIKKFQTEFKKIFDQELIDGNDEPQVVALESALKSIAEDKNKYNIEKIATALSLGDPDTSGKYLADLLKFMMRRISPERRQHSLDNLKKKIYYLNEYDMASKKAPNSAAIGQSITLLKHILLEHDAKYIRAVLNSIVKYL